MRTTSPLPAYLGSFIVLGCLFSIGGPSLGWVRDRTGVGIGTSGLILTAGSVGYVAASSAVGRWYDRGAGHRLLLGAFAVAVIVVLLAGWLPGFVFALVVFASIGAAGGVIDVGGNTLVVWSQPAARVASSLNALHLCFGVGALATPLLVAWSIELTGDLTVVAGAVLVGALVVTGLLRGRSVPERRPPPDDTSGAEPGVASIAAVCGFFFLYVGSEVLLFGWATTYAEVERIGGDTPELLATVVLAGFTVGRVLGIVAARHVRSVVLVSVSCTTAWCASLGLVLGHDREIVVWTAMALIGVALGPQYPTMMAYADEHLRLSGAVTSRIVAASGVGGLLLPLLTGWWLDRAGGAALPWATTVGLGLTLASAGMVVAVFRRYGAMPCAP